MNASRDSWNRPENWAGVLITISFHAACAALLQATWPPATGSASHNPPARYVHWIESHAGPGPNAWDSDPRALRSPVLFALPTAAGFSPAPRRYVETLPAFQIPGIEDLLLDRLAPAPIAPIVSDRTTEDVRRLLEHRWAPIDSPSDPFAIPPATNTVVIVEWPDGSPEWIAGLPLAIQPPAAPGERAWEASAWVHVSAAGDIASVFLAQPTADRERNDAIVRALRALRTAPGREGRYRASLYLLPAPERAAGVAP